MGLSSKLFEYLATGNPALVIRPTVPDADLLEGITWVQTQSEPNVADALRFIGDTADRKMQADEAWLQNYRSCYSRRSQTQQLAGLLDQVVLNGSPAGEMKETL